MHALGHEEVVCRALHDLVTQTWNVAGNKRTDLFALSLTMAFITTKSHLHKCSHAFPFNVRTDLFRAKYCPFQGLQARHCLGNRKWQWPARFHCWQVKCKSSAGSNKIKRRTSQHEGDVVRGKNSPNSNPPRTVAERWCQDWRHSKEFTNDTPRSPPDSNPELGEMLQKRNAPGCVSNSSWHS